MIQEGADIIDVVVNDRPGSEFVQSRRVAPCDSGDRAGRIRSSPVSIDTTKPSVARAALEAGAEIVNDISGLRSIQAIADEVAKAKAG